MSETFCEMYKHDCPECPNRHICPSSLQPNELIIYWNGDSYELGKIKRLCPDGAFVWYHDGETAAKTPYDCIHKLINRRCIVMTTLGGTNGLERC